MDIADDVDVGDGLRRVIQDAVGAKMRWHFGRASQCPASSIRTALEIICCLRYDSIERKERINLQRKVKMINNKTWAQILEQETNRMLSVRSAHVSFVVIDGKTLRVVQINPPRASSYVIFLYVAPEPLKMIRVIWLASGPKHFHGMLPFIRASKLYEAAPHLIAENATLNRTIEIEDATEKENKVAKSSQVWESAMGDHFLPRRNDTETAVERLNILDELVPFL